MTALSAGVRRAALPLLGLLLLVGSAQALPALPIQVDQSVATPLGSVQAGTDGQSLHACADAAAPALPALPLPMGLPIATDANANTCLDAGLDGIDAAADAQAAGQGIAIDHQMDTSAAHGLVDSTAGAVAGFFGAIWSAVAGLF